MTEIVLHSTEIVNALANAIVVAAQIDKEFQMMRIEIHGLRALKAELERQNHKQSVLIEDLQETIGILTHACQQYATKDKDKRCDEPA